MNSASYKRQHSIAVSILALVLVLSPVLHARPLEVGSNLPPPNGHVNDFAGVIDTVTERRLENLLENLEQRSGINYVVVTVKTSGDRDLYDYSLTVASDWNVWSTASTRKTVLTVIATDSAKFFTQSSQTAQRDLPTGLIGYMGRRMRPQFQTGNYAEGLLTGIQAFASILGERFNFTFEALDHTLSKSSVAKTEPAAAPVVGEQLSRAPHRNASRLATDSNSVKTPTTSDTAKSAGVDSSSGRPVQPPKNIKDPPRSAEAKTSSATDIKSAADLVAGLTPKAKSDSKLPVTVTTPAPQSTKTSTSLKSPIGSGVLFGRIVDTVGALVVGATVTVTDTTGTQKTATTDGEGNYTISNLASGEYIVRASAPGFADYEDPGVVVDSARRQPLNIKLEVTIGKQEVTVAAEAPLGSSLNMRVLRGKDLAALPRGPGGLTAALRTLAVPATGPGGPQILVDGFPGGRLPPKDSIREIRINENPFSSEYPQLGFGRIEILTKPGSEKFHTSAFFNFNDESLNSRNPFASNRAAFQSRLYGGSVSGPIHAKRSSFFVDFERHEVDNNALINASVLDSDFNITQFTQALLTPQRHTTFSPRFEFQLNRAHTLVARYSYARGRATNGGIGEFSLASRALTMNRSEHLLQLTETAVLGPNLINELRFQYVGNRRREIGDNSLPTILVPEAFIGGGSEFGLSFKNEDRWELQNYASWAFRRHNVKAGAQVRGVQLTESATENFNGTFTFGGGLAPELDAANNVVRDASGQPVIVPITGIERYRRTQFSSLFHQRGLTQAEIRSLGVGPTQFSIAAGDPEAGVSQYDLGLFLQDDWQLHPNLTLGAGLRYEMQNHLSGRADFAPRLAVAWAPGADPNQRKTVVRAGIGLFYDRFSEAYTLEAQRFEGSQEQRFIVSDPGILDGFPQVPSIATIRGFALRPSITRVSSDLRAPYTIQSSVGLERELPGGFTLATTFINTRTLHMLRSRNVNAPLPGTTVNGIRPFGNVGDIFEFESSGYFKQSQLAVNVMNRLKDMMTLWATYVLNKAVSDTDGANTFPANTYDLTTERGRSSLDVRHSFYLGGWITAPGKISLSPLLFFRSGTPFNVTTGRDTNGDTQFMERPSFATDLSRGSVVLTRFGAFDLDPLPGQTIIPRNYGRGPGFFSMNLGISRAFSFGPEGGTAKATAGRNSFRSFLATRRYTLTFTVQVENLFNNTNPGLPVGNLSSPFFGQSYSSAGAFGFGNNPGGNRRIEFQIYLNF